MRPTWVAEGTRNMCFGLIRLDQSAHFLRQLPLAERHLPSSHSDLLMKNKRPPTSVLFTSPDQAITQCLCVSWGRGNAGRDSETWGLQWGVMAGRKACWPPGLSQNAWPLCYYPCLPRAALCCPTSPPIIPKLWLFLSNQTLMQGHSPQWLRAQDLAWHYPSRRTHSVNLDKGLHLLEPQCGLLWNGDENNQLIGLNEVSHIKSQVHNEPSKDISRSSEV